MSVFAKATPAIVPKTQRVTQISLFYAGILVVLALSQLYSFEEFTELITGFGLPLAAAPIIIVLEVFALPFLLRMAISPAFRFVSMVFGWLVPAFWFFVSIWVLFNVGGAETVGFLGTVLALQPGWWAVLFSFALGILAAWASWGMWPLKTAKK